jgi:hypothetical protein
VKLNLIQQRDILLFKLNGTNGEVIFARSFGSIWNDEASSVSCDSMNHIFLQIKYHGNVTIDRVFMSGETQSDDYMALVLFGSNGKAITATGIQGGTNLPQPQSMVIGPSDHIYTTGLFTSSLQLNSQSVTAIGFDVFVAKFPTTDQSLFETVCANDTDCNGGMCLGYKCVCSIDSFGRLCEHNCTSFQAIIAGPDEQMILRASPYELSALLKLPPCITGDIKTIEVNWTRVLSSGYNLHPNFFNGTVRGLKVPFPDSSFPESDASYIFRMDAAINTDSERYVQSAQVTVQVKRSNPIAIIENGNRRLPLFKNVVFNASRSYYPEKLQNKVETFLWTCTVVQNGNVDTGIPCPFPIPNNSSSAIQIYLNVSGAFRFTVVYSVAGRTDTATSDVSVSSEFAPITRIMNALPAFLSRRTKLKLQARVDYHSIEYKPNMYYYQWQIFKADHGNLTNVPIPSDNLQTKDTSQLELAFVCEFLEPNSTYSFRFTVTNKTDTSVFTFAELIGRTGVPPTGGTIEIHPAFGSSLSTNFMIVASGWKAPDEMKPISYAFERQDSTGKWLPLTPFSKMESINRQLPPGFGPLEQVPIRIRIQNAYGDETLVNATANVTARSFSGPQQAISALQSARATLLSARDQYGLEDGQLESSILMMADTLKRNIDPNELTDAQKAVAYQFKDTLFQYLQQSQEEANAFSAEYRQQQANAMATLCKQGIDYGSTSTVLGIVKQILNVDDDDDFEDQINTDILSYSADALSNILEHTFSEEDYGVTSVSIIQSIAESATKLKVAGEDDTVIESDNLRILVSLNYIDDIASAEITDSNDGKVILPDNIADIEALSDSDVVGYHYYTYKQNPYSWSNSSSNNITSTVVTFKLVDESGSKISLSDLSSPIILKLYVSSNSSLLGNESYMCMYWNEDDSDQSDWKQSGCEFLNRTDDYIYCSCDHTTSFAAFVTYESVNGTLPDLTEVDKAIYIVSIAINSVLILVIILLLAILSLLHKTQPVRSRFIFPFIGLFAVLVDCALQGVVRSGLLLANSDPTRSAVNSVGYAIMVVANPLSLLAWFLFLWQLIRFLFLKHIYETMAKNARAVKAVFRIIISKTIYLALCALVFVVTCIYFLVFSILGATDSTSMSAADITTATVLFYAIGSLVLGVLVLAAIVWDIATSNLFKKSKLKKENNFVTSITSLIQYHFVRDDPLYFRIESMIMVLTILVSIVAYSIGIYDLYSTNTEDSAIKVVEFAFSIAYQVLRILVFGGFISIVALRRAIASRSLGLGYSKKVVDEDTLYEITNLLNEERGYRLVSQYATTEFSLENILIYEQIVQLRNDIELSKLDNMIKDLLEIRDQFIIPKSPNEVNIPATIRRKYLGLCTEEDISPEKADQILKELFRSIMVNISDTWVRFIETKEYKTHVGILTMTKELNDVNNK